MIIVDTSIWVDFLRGHDTAQVLRLVDLIEGDEGVGITDVILSEILQGAPSEAAARRLDSRFAAFDCLRLESLEDFRRAARLYRGARSAGHTIRRTLDCLIAAVCIREDVPLLHSDADFDRLAASSELRIA
jgi:predicted nucleic acid-binding protein